MKAIFQREEVRQTEKYEKTETSKKTVKNSLGERGTTQKCDICIYMNTNNISEGGGTAN